jgi:hypothetical protein
MSIHRALEADRAGEPVRVYHKNGSLKRTASRVWTHPLDEWCVACESNGRILPRHVKRGDVTPTPESLASDRAALKRRAERPRRGRGTARAALDAINAAKEEA